jgi:putative transposase
MQKCISLKIIKKDCFCERHRISIPTLKWVRIKEKGYIPTTKNGYVLLTT